jgi:hypothetical protein
MSRVAIRKRLKEHMENLWNRIRKAFAIHIDSKCPSELEPVLAQIEHTNSLGKSSWCEVVYFDGDWRCYAGSDTFKDGEKVVRWRYCKDCC